MHDVFSDPYRSAILYHLQDGDGSVSVDHVVDRVRRRCPDVDEGADRERLRSWLVQSHVAQLEEFGIVHRDREADTVTLADDVSVSVSRPWDDG